MRSTSLHCNFAVELVGLFSHSYSISVTSGALLTLFFVTGGLLHSAPKHEEEHGVPMKIKKALRECVEEKTPGARVKAVNDLADLLALFVRLR